MFLTPEFPAHSSPTPVLPFPPSHEDACAHVAYNCALSIFWFYALAKLVSILAQKVNWSFHVDNNWDNNVRYLNFESDVSSIGYFRFPHYL